MKAWAYIEEPYNEKLISYLVLIILSAYIIIQAIISSFESKCKW